MIVMQQSHAIAITLKIAQPYIKAFYILAMHFDCHYYTRAKI